MGNPLICPKDLGQMDQPNPSKPVYVCRECGYVEGEERDSSRKNDGPTPSRSGEGTG
jgi:hypothetical protein